MTILTPARPVRYIGPGEPDDFAPNSAPRRSIDLAAWQAETEVMPPKRSRDGIPTRLPNSYDTRPRSALLPAGANPLDDIAALISALTYGEMIELAQAMWKRRDEGEITREMLPVIWHRWATTQRE